MLVKIIGSAIVILSGFLGGRYISLTNTLRLEELHLLKEIMILLKGEIRYSITPLPEAFIRVGEKENNAYGKWFVNMGERLSEYNGTNIKDVWCEELEKIGQDTYLNSKDKKMLESIGTSIGFLDKEMQINAIELYLEQLENMIEQTNATIGEKLKLYNVLGIMLGILVVIVLI